MAVRAPWTIPHCHDAIPSMRRCSSLSDAARGGVRGQPTVGGPDPEMGFTFRSPPGRPRSHAHARRGRFESRRSSGDVRLQPGLRRRAAGVPPRTPSQRPPSLTERYRAMKTSVITDRRGFLQRKLLCRGLIPGFRLYPRPTQGVIGCYTACNTMKHREAAKEPNSTHHPVPAHD